LQPLADGLKLLIKEFLLPLKAINFFLYLLLFIFNYSFATWSIIPFEFHVVHLLTKLSLFSSFFFVICYGILLGGWASNSRYAF